MWEAIQFHNVSIGYQKGHPILHHVSFSLKNGDFCYLTGASGAGKSSLIKLIYGDMRPLHGSVTVLEHDMSALGRQDLSLLRQQIGVVFQQFHLIEDLSAVENVALPLRIRGASWRQSINRAKEILTFIGFEESFQTLPKNLSGGQKQRVVIGRALINNPRIILADEPTGNLDDDNAIRLMNLFRELNQGGTTILFATHNHGLIRCFPYPELHIHNKTIVEQSLSHHLPHPHPLQDGLHHAI